MILMAIHLICLEKDLPVRRNAAQTVFLHGIGNMTVILRSKEISIQH